MTRTEAVATGAAGAAEDRLCPVTPVQRDLYLHQVRHPDSTVYSLGVAAPLPADVDVDRWRAALAQVWSGEPLAGTAFRVRSGEVVQDVGEPSVPPFEEVRLDGDPRQAFAAFVADRVKVPYDLGAAPLVRDYVCRTADGAVTAVVAAPHVLLDAASGRLLFERAARAYRGERTGPHGRFADHAAAVAARFDRPDTLRFWDEVGREVQPLRSDVRDAARPVRALTLSPAEAEALRELGRRGGVGPAAALMTVYAAVVAEYCRPDGPLAVYDVRGGRDAGVQDVLGCFYHVQPNLFDPAVGDLDGWLTELARFRRNLGQHRYLSVAQQRRCLPSTGLSWYVNYYAFAPVELLGRRGLVLPLDSFPADEVHLLATPDFDGSLALSLEYDDTAFDGATLLPRLRALLRQATTGDLGGRRRHVPLLAGERESRAAGPATTAPVLPIHLSFAEQAAATPDGTAVVAATGARLTYAELDRRTDQLAGLLRGLGVGAEAVVGVLLERGTALPVALMGTLKAGGCYLPLDADDPRSAQLLADARATAVVTAPSLAARVPAPYPAVLLGDDLAALDGLPRVVPARPASADQAAYLIFTSGSTGSPKGALVSHGAIANRLAWMQHDHRLTPADRVLHKTPTTFDVSLWELCWPLLTGATLVLAAPGAHRDPDELVDTIRSRAVTTVHFVPSMLAAFLDHHAVPALDSLRRVVASGEALDPALAARCLERTGAELHNLYGPTEAAVDVTAWRCEPGAPEVPIGYPVANTTACLLAPDGAPRPVPPGFVGELCLGGVQLARGYHGRPGLTAERFVPDPAGGGRRLYRTGDLARQRPDGALDYLGRCDQQVKVRGMRVEPGEVQSALLADQRVAAAAVVAVGTGRDTRLAAYVVPSAGCEPSPAELTARLAERLPAYLVPATCQLVPELPVTRSGKLDRAALPEPAARAGARTPPRTATEARLAALCAELLGLPAVGVDDDFFVLGGHSLLATTLVRRARERCGLDLRVADVFTARTVAGLAAAARPVPPEPEPASGSLLPRVPRGGPLPVGLTQERIWFLRRLAPDAIAYQFQFAVRWRGRLDVPRLQHALNRLVERHEMLRTTFGEVDGEPRQWVWPPFPVSLPIVDTTADELDGQLHTFVRQRIDPERLPLVRWRLYRLADDEHVLVQVEHHFVHDGWSMGVLLRDLCASYRGDEPPALTRQFADVACWQQAQRSAGRFDEDVAYWVRRLTGAPRQLDLPTDRPRPPQPTFAGDVHREPVDRELYAALRGLAVRCGATPYMVLLAAFHVLLHRYTGATDLVIATGVANRNPREAEPLLGMFVNTLALRADLSGDPPFTGLLDRVRRDAEEAYQHQEAPFGDVVASLYTERDPSVNPLSQVMFSFHDAPMPNLVLPGVRGEVVELANGSAKADLNVVVVARPEQKVGRTGGNAADVLLWWEYSTDVFTADTVAAMARHYVTLLRGLVAEPHARIGDLPLAPPEPEHRELPVEPPVELPAGLPRATEPTVAELVARQADRRPAMPAVRDQHGRELTYRELVAKAEHVAARLRAAGVASETPVALSLSRSPEWIVALLAVLCAGGAFVPLDPAQPAGRRHRMLADCEARIGVTDTAGRAADPGGGTGGPRWHLMSDLAEPAPAATGTRQPGLPDHLAYVLYTSGSTGSPKGVAVTHRGLANLARWHRGAYRLGPGDRVSHLAGLGFDALVEEIFPALTAGATVCLTPEHLRADPAALLDWLHTEAITVAFVPTPVAEQLFGLPWPAGCRLRYLLTGGERLTRRPPAGIRCTVVNQYGPTENTVVATAGPVAADGAGLPDIGTAIDGVTLTVVDQRLRPVPAGVPGELCLGGASLARGYYGQPGQTAAAFVPGPGGSRRYRTGDRVRGRADGVLQFAGRLDDQVKIRGVRVEPAEIESVLAAHPDVAAAAVRLDGRRPDRLVAYVVGRDGPVEQAALHDHLADRLPAVMVPDVWVPMDTLPLTPSGKLDRSALPDPADRGAEPAQRGEPPATPTEQLVARAFSEVLELPEVARTDDFFRLGGHSLNAARVLAKLGDDLPLLVLFGNPTVAALARFLDASPSTPAPAPGPGEPPEPDDPLAGLSGDEIDALLFAADREEAR